MTVSPIESLKKIMRQLRDPETGCPWDIEQTFESIVAHTIEESYEVAEAVDKKDYVSLKAELGDLLLQVIFYSQIASEKSLFSFDDVVEGVCNKLVFRHPHVFGSHKVESVSEQQKLWSELKEKERQEKASEQGVKASVLDDIPSAFPALIRATKIQKRASSVGFDWPDHQGAIDKLKEEIAELEEAVESGSLLMQEDEMGDLLFAVVNISRKLNILPEEALRKANQKFERRFRHVEEALDKQCKGWEGTSLGEMEEYWQKAKSKVG